MTPEDRPQEPNKDLTRKDTINKSVFLNWLYLSGEEVSITEIGKLIEARTNGQYILVNRDELKQ